MRYKVEFTPTAVRSLKKMDKYQASWRHGAFVAPIKDEDKK